MGSAIVAGITDGAVLGLMALGLVLVYKATRVLNFAQGEIGTFSLYVSWLVFGEGRVPVVVAVLAGVLFAAAFGAAMERVVIRPLIDAPRLTLTVVTLGISTMLAGLEIALWGINPKVLPALVSGSGPQVAGVRVQPGRILAIAVTVGLGLALWAFFKRTLFGLGVLAAAQNPVALRLMGLPLARVSMFTWAAGGVLAAAAGLILAPTIGAFHPFFMTLVLIPSLAAALVGGLTSLPGAFVGGVVVGVVQSVTRHLFASDIPQVEFAASFGLILGVLLLRPRGLFGAEA